ncbi:hypothetical protein NCF86_03625 [Pelagerythrobacter marinus]|nr:hypothetical protein NCF86_03625 [Pelagerythrobacter marinus]
MTARTKKRSVSGKVLHLPSAEDTQLQRTRALADAFAQLDAAEQAYREAQAAVSAAFGPWSAGRRISRDEARAQLISTGHLPRRRVWE